MHINGIMFATGIENSYPMIGLPDGSRKRIYRDLIRTWQPFLEARKFGLLLP